MSASYICRKSQYATIKFARLTEYAFPPSMFLLLLCYMAYSYMQWMKEGILCSCFSQGIRCKVPLFSCVRSILTNCWLQSTDLLTPVNRVADSMSTGLLTLCQQLKDSINSFFSFIRLTWTARSSHCHTSGVPRSGGVARNHSPCRVQRRRCHLPSIGFSRK